MKKTRARRGWRSILAVVAAIAPMPAFVVGARAQASLPLYTDNLVNGFQDWSWAPLNLANPSPVHSGIRSISVSPGAAWQAVALHQSDFSTSPYDSLTFWANGGAGGGQTLQVLAVLGGVTGPPFAAPALKAGVWQQVTVPLSAIGAANKTNCEGFWLQVTSGGSLGTFYLDDVQLNAASAPLLVHLAVNAAQPLRTVDPRMFGLNAAVWDGSVDTPDTLAELREIGCSMLRFPGGSLSDEYHWASNTTDSNTWQWASSFTKLAQITTNLGAQALITVNYGTGTAAEAADWVRAANVTNRYGFKHWEVGNEVYGTWETDSNTFPHDAYTYATRAASYIQQMKAADPSIKIGVVAVVGETNNINGYTSHPARNPRTGLNNYGWTPVMLSTLKTAGATPDFLIYHWYPEYTDGESDALVLQSSAIWPAAAADLRRQIQDYFGPGGTNIELLCTENNSNSGAQGRQSTSLVNALYLADNLGRLMTTEFNSYVWWDLRNGADTGGDMDPSLYGWRANGDLGMIDGLTNRYPDFYGMKLMSYFARGGDSVLAAASDYLLLTAYAVRHADGSLGVLVLNKDTATNFNAQIAVAGFAPSSDATVLSYGIPQDNAARIGTGSQDIASSSFAIAGAAFQYSFPPLSLTLFSLPPAAPLLTARSTAPTAGGEFLVQLQGSAGAPYVIQTSTDLLVWAPVRTNTLVSGTMTLTNVIAPGPSQGFWRAVWRSDE
jgi:alpha-N-arabinofuranosidase